MARSQHPLGVVDPPENPDDAIVVRPGAELEALALMPEEAENDLVCGSCETVLVKGQTVATLWLKVVAHKPFLIVCPACAAYNAVPTRSGGAEEIFWLLPDPE